MIYLLLKRINPDRRIYASNLKDKIDKSTLDKFGNNVKELLDDMFSNYSIVIDKVERHEDCIGHIFRDILSGPNSTLNHSIESTKENWYT